MNTEPTIANRHTKAREAALRQIAQTGPFLEGYLSPVKRRGSTTLAWQLTFKQKGRTRTLYIPKGMVPEVQAWTANFKALKQLIREVTRHSRALIRSYVADQQAAKRRQALTSL